MDRTDEERELTSSAVSRLLDLPDVTTYTKEDLLKTLRECEATDDPKDIPPPLYKYVYL